MRTGINLRLNINSMKFFYGEKMNIYVILLNRYRKYIDEREKIKHHCGRCGCVHLTAYEDGIGCAICKCSRMRMVRKVLREHKETL